MHAGDDQHVDGPGLEPNLLGETMPGNLLEQRVSGRGSTAQECLEPLLLPRELRL